jgi:hypothetical protein
MIGRLRIQGAESGTNLPLVQGLFLLVEVGYQCLWLTVLKIISPCAGQLVVSQNQDHINNQYPKVRSSP